MSMRKLERRVYCFDENFKDMGWTRVVMAEDLKRCASCGYRHIEDWYQDEDHEVKPTGSVCTLHDRKVSQDDFCVWWDKEGNEIL